MRTAALVLGLAPALWTGALAGGPGTARAEEPVEEMPVIGARRPAMDVLAGASTTRIGTDERLVELARIDDLLAEVPGVQVRRFGGVGERFELSIRGSRPEQVPVFLDGVRLDTSLTGSSDLSTLCLDVLDEIQVTRGAGAARAGTGAIGGVVNLVSRPARAEPETRVRLAGGSFESIEGSIRHARRRGPWEASFSYCGFRTKGDYRFQRARFVTDGTPIGSATILERINNEAVRHTGLAQIGRSVGRGELRLSQLTSGLVRGVPGSERDQRAEAREHNVSTLTALRFEHPLARPTSAREADPGDADRSSAPTLELVLAHRYERNDYRDPAPQLLLARDPIDSTTRLHGLSGRLGVRGEVTALGGLHALSLVGEGRYDRRTSNEAEAESRAGFALRAELDASWWQDRLHLAPSLRLERYEGLDLEWIPALHVRVDPLDWITLRAAIARSYRIPSFQELYLPDRGFERGNPDLRPERAWSGEAGVTLHSPFEADWLDARVDFTAFAGEIDDSIAYQVISTNVASFRNTGRSQTRGYELAVAWQPHPWVRLTAARTVTRAELESIDRQVAGVAVSQTDGRLELGPRDRLRLVGEIHYTGRINASQGGNAVIPSRISFDASAAIDLAKFPPLRERARGRALWLSVRGRNLGDEALRDARFLPRPGRSFAVALESVF
ncbi:MAG: TonB-dependent receptor [Spirochaetaceae bacterium]|nr:TonB-dependent receptor [Myxococcales bacterium]MCB9723641.1 TonB-dependent receptor [Spirochaetaceae bacterium]